MDYLADLVLGAQCPGCRSPGLGLCAECLPLLRAGAGAGAVGGLPLAWAADYRTVMRAALIHAKERHALGLIPPLARLIPDALAEIPGLAARPPPVALLVPVPTAWAHIVERGIDFTWELGRRGAKLAARQGLSLRAVRALGFTRRPADQAGLSAAERRENLRGAFRWRAPAPSVPVVLLDDVVTTGATILEARRAAQAGGAQVLGAVSLARRLSRA
ncbi:MAG: ComF family protein [Propionibacteriaceae bacterium]|nr:ComF family protein [Propionibacteriaceae bacterium]